MPVARIRDIDVYYEVHGEGEPLMLVHGLGSSTEDWAPQVDYFARQYKVVTYDVRGHGRTAKPKAPYSVKQFAEDTAALIQYLGLGATHVMGISMGGMIALQLVADHPSLVRTLTVVNSGPELVLRTWKQRVGIYQRFVIVRLMGMRKMGQVLSTALLPRPEHADARRTFVERWARNEPGAYLRSLRALIGWSVTDRLGAIASPTLVVGADQDYTSVAFKQEYTNAIPTARLVVVPDSRHMLPVERPAEFNAVVGQFLSGSRAKAGKLPHAPAGSTVRT